MFIIFSKKRDRIPRVDDAIKFCKDFLAGATAAVVAKTIVAPIERVKLILQLQTAQETIAVSKRYKGMIDCFIRVPREQGFLSFWRGNMVNIARACSQESLGFAFKDFFKIWCVSGVNSKDNYWRFLSGNIAAGGASGISTYCIIYPLDFVRTRRVVLVFAIDMGKEKSREFTGFFDCMRKIFRSDGIRGLYYGFFPSLQYIFLYRGAYYGLFDSAKVLVSKKENNQINFLAAFIIGQVVTFTAAFISYPWDTVRRRLMMQAGRTDTLYRGVWHCTTKIYYEEGVRAFFSGMLVNAVRGTGAALVLALYNEFSKYM
ncbi:ADP/ATP translocase 4 [Toxocara canis]|uniref:ADP/ATP translocase n=1 Tax=Toxocara canis TaxID=6265 RepID=A0A0B2VTG8_TOXCA|nr:ADP/ATP translocase 4 [Toxocara canis]